MRKRSKPRPYDASGRRQRAQESQERMLEVARALFAERGYVETTMDEIAKRAEVAVPTLYAAFGSKRARLSTLIDRLGSGAPGSPPILQTQSAQQAMADPD